MNELRDTLHRGVLSEVIGLWFNHITSPEHLILPPNKVTSKWFQADSEFDKACVYVSAPLSNSEVHTV